MVSVEANIGTGKSTFLKIFGNKWPDKFNIIYEPLDEWQNTYSDGDKNILGMFYGNKPRWSYTFQTNAFITRIQKYQSEKVQDKINLTERSILSDHHIFANMLRDDGEINTIEWKLYENWFNWLNKKFDAQPQQIIYLRCDPETAYERMKKRSRSEETTISLEYLTRLHEYHDRWLLNEQNIPVKVINVDEDFINNDEKINKMFEEVISFS